MTEKRPGVDYRVSRNKVATPTDEYLGALGAQEGTRVGVGSVGSQRAQVSAQGGTQHAHAHHRHAKAASGGGEAAQALGYSGQDSFQAAAAKGGGAGAPAGGGEAGAPAEGKGGKGGKGGGGKAGKAGGGKAGAGGAGGAPPGGAEAGAPPGGAEGAVAGVDITQILQQLQSLMGQLGGAAGQ